MSRPSFLLVGNCVIDDVLELPFFPNEDDEIRALERHRAVGGNTGNSAQILAQLGHRVSLCSSMASDDAAIWARTRLRDMDIDIRCCQIHADGASPLSTIWLNNSSGKRTIVHHRNLPELSLDHLKSINCSAFDWIHFEGRNIEVLNQLLPDLETERAHISLEIEKPRQNIEALAAFADTVIVSSHYLRESKLDPKTCMQQLRKINPEARIICTLGEQGLSATDITGRTLSIPAIRVDPVIDSIGAGDCFIAGLISALSSGEEFSNALQFANQLAARKISNQGMNIHDQS